MLHDFKEWKEEEYIKHETFKMTKEELIAKLRRDPNFEAYSKEEINELVYSDIPFICKVIRTNNGAQVKFKYLIDLTDNERIEMEDVISLLPEIAINPE